MEFECSHAYILTSVPDTFNTTINYMIRLESKKNVG